MNKGITHEFFKGFWEILPPFRLVLGLCPVLAVTTAVENGIGMGLATTFVLVFSNVIIASIKNLIPKKVRIASYIVIIATFVVIVELTMKAFFFAISRQLDLFINLIVVNCIILGRAEAFASKNGVLASIIDGLGMGLGFTLALTILGGTREILGAFSLFNVKFASEDASTILLFILPPGAFIALGFLIAFINRLTKKAA